MPNVYHLFRATWRLFLAFGRAWWYARSHLAKALNLPKNLAFDTQERRRQGHYFYGSTFLAAVMGSLLGQNRSRSETYLFANLSALACYFDDLVDVVREKAEAFSWHDNPENYGKTLDKRGLALYLLQNIYRELPEMSQATFQKYMRQVFNVETNGTQLPGSGVLLRDTPTGSWQQVHPYELQLYMEQLKSLTAEKGGASVLLFRSLLSQDISKEETYALYQFGHLIQFSDDIFDIWHDRRAGIVTMATHLAGKGELEILKKLYEEQVSATYSAIRQTSFPSVQIETTVYSLHYLVSITRICLQHYLDVVRKIGSLPIHNRTIMVVDMETFNNRWQLVRYLFRPLS